VGLSISIILHGLLSEVSFITNSKLVELPGVNHLPYLDDTSLLVGEIEEFLTGKKGEGSLAKDDPNTGRALATILFTDIVNSTENAAKVGDHKWKDILDLLDRVSKEQVEIYRGRYIKSTGDGLLAVFDGPGRAISCAKAIGDHLRNEDIEIRSGLHTGEIELRGTDIGGISVHITSRIESKAEPGQILVSRTVTELVAGSGFDFIEVGVHELKGIPGSWRLFAVA
jgi:class 3 adenylate cyclase